MDDLIASIGMGLLGAWLVYQVAHWRGRMSQQDLWKDHMAKCNQYVYAVDDLEKWCGDTSPHAKLIARHLKAHGEGLGCNAGTPNEDEACTVSGLREQLRRLDSKFALIETEDA